jgi:hypothetical protein
MGIGEKLLGCDDDAYSGKLVRVDLEDFKTVEVLDLAKVHPDLVGFNGAFTGRTTRNHKHAVFVSYVIYTAY